jgi:hypothetical protein
MKRVAAAALILAAITGCRPGAPPPPAVPQPYRSGEQLIEAMQNRYAGRWYRTLTFVQATTSIAPDGSEQTSIWYEAALLPSRLRIDYDPIQMGNGVLVRADTQYVFQRGNQVRAIPRTNELLLLGFDIYFLEPAFTAAWLRRLGFDLSTVRRDVWQGRDVYVVGAASPADLRARQFWVDTENLLFVRLLQPAADSTQTNDIRFAKYERIGRAWVATVVEVMRAGQLVFKEEYRHVRIDQPLDSALFDPATWSTARHWYQDR